MYQLFGANLKSFYYKDTGKKRAENATTYLTW